MSGASPFCMDAADIFYTDRTLFLPHICRSIPHTFHGWLLTASRFHPSSLVSSVTGIHSPAASFPIVLGSQVPRRIMVLMFCREIPLCAARAAFVMPRSASRVSSLVVLMIIRFFTSLYFNFEVSCLHSLLFIVVLLSL